jgi:hypothetical protein
MDSEELLYRQVLPAWVQDGRPSGQAFTPTKKDKYKLSVDRESLITAEGAFFLHTDGRNLRSAGTWAITVAQCAQKTLGCFSDPLASPPELVPDPAHCLVDFEPLSKSRRAMAGSFLATAAHARGCIFSAPQTEQRG